MINELLKFIQETLPCVKKDKETSVLMKYKDLAVLYNLPSLVIPRKFYTLPHFLLFWKIIKLYSKMQCVMVSSSSEKPIHEIDKATFRDELQRSVLLTMNEQIEDQPESRTVDVYKTHLELLSKRLKYKGRHTVYTACMIGQCLSDLQQKYQRNKKLFTCATKNLFTISYVHFFH